ncbi:MAG: hypothetical protein L3J16_00035 [Anaerolineales bacterium]|nr:hypothetical protein [Anaerolineales bacterium]
MKKRRILLTTGLGLLFSVACAIVTPAPSAVPSNAPTLNTPVSLPSTQAPPKQAPPTVAADAFAPDPLTVEWIDIPFAPGGCMDMDNLQPVTDASCDVELASDGWLITPRNGGLFSGYGSLTPPSKNDCIASETASELSGNPLALMTDLYLCFKTNQGTYGFFVMRSGPDENGFNVTVFDAYLFP